MRMEYSGTTEQDEEKVRNRLQQRMARTREKFIMVSWRDRAGENNAIRDRVLNKLTPAQLAARGGLGTTRGSTPGSIDVQGNVIQVPGRRARGTVEVANIPTQVQQPHGQVSHAGPSNAPLQEYRPAGYKGFSAVNSQDFQPLNSHGGSRNGQQQVQNNSGNAKRQQQARASSSSEPFPNRRRNVDRIATMRVSQQSHPLISYMANTVQQPYSERIQNVGSSYEATRPIIDGRRAASAENTMRRSSTVYPGEEYTPNIHTTTSHASTPRVLQRHHTHSSDGNGVDNEDYDGDDNIYNKRYSDDGDDHSGVEETGEGYGNENDVKEEPDAEMALVGEDPRQEPLTAEEYRELQRYLEEDRTQIQMRMDGRISTAELMSNMHHNEAKLRSGLKRARWQVSDDDEVEEVQNQRAKRSKRGEADQGASINTSRRPATQPIGSAVQRLHNDRLRRPAPKATVGQQNTYESPRYHQPDTSENTHTVTNVQTDVQQPQHSPQQGNRYSHTLSNLNSHQPGASAIQDDPIFADELLDETLDGQPSNNHVEGIGTHAEQQAIDEYYRRLMTPRPGIAPDSTVPEAPVPSTPRSRTKQPSTVSMLDLLNPHSRPQAAQPGLALRHPVPDLPTSPSQTGNAGSGARVPSGTLLLSADASDFVVAGDDTLWSSEWAAFVNDHDAEPLLLAHYPDEYPSDSPPDAPLYLEDGVLE